MALTYTTPVHSALLESLINPLQERIEDWKKSVNQLDKDHAKEYKRARHEIKKKSSDTLKLQKKARKGRAQSSPRRHSPTSPLHIPRRPLRRPRASSWPEGPYAGHRALQSVGWEEGASLHPRPGPRPPLSGRRQEAPQARALPTPPQEGLCPSGCLSHILSFSVSPSPTSFL